jgi:hypothetical protein
VDGRTALQHAIMSVPVPGAPPRQFSAAAIGLSFLDSALRLNHVRRLTERLTITDHRVARRITEIDISLRMLDSGQRHAATLSRELRNAGPRRGGSRADRIWVPVARISRQSAAPVEVFDAAGSRLPRLTQYEASRLLASGLFRLLRGILDSLPSATPESDLHRFLHRAHESEWLVQHAIDILMTERHRPEAVLPRLTSEGVLEGQERATDHLRWPCSTSTRLSLPTSSSARTATAWTTAATSPHRSRRTTWSWRPRRAWTSHGCT